LDQKETVLSHNKVTGWSVNLPIAKTCQPSKVCINTCYFSKGGSSWPASLTKQVRVYNSIKGDPKGTASRIARECVKNKATYLRWNGGGDLFDESIDCLMEVAHILPEMPIWVVTRIPAMAAKVPDAKNVFVHFSLDRHRVEEGRHGNHLPSQLAQVRRERHLRHLRDLPTLLRQQRLEARAQDHGSPSRGVNFRELSHARE